MKKNGQVAGRSNRNSLRAPLKEPEKAGCGGVACSSSTGKVKTGISSSRPIWDTWVVWGQSWLPSELFLQTNKYTLKRWIWHFLARCSIVCEYVCVYTEMYITTLNLYLTLTLPCKVQSSVGVYREIYVTLHIKLFTFELWMLLNSRASIQLAWGPGFSTQTQHGQAKHWDIHTADTTSLKRMNVLGEWTCLESIGNQHYISVINLFFKKKL